MNQNRFQDLQQWARQVLREPQLQLGLISGDASFRRYYRGGGVIWVDAPPQTEKNHEFVRNAQALQEAGIAAPQVKAADFTHGFMALSDLGDTSLLSLLDSNSVATWYGKAISLLPRIARVPLVLEPFDRSFMARENAIFPEWLLERHLGFSLSSAERQMLSAMFDYLAEYNLAQPQVTMHRDYHSRNLMVLESGELAVIDFQDMVTGPLTYDLVSLLKDCYVRWPASVIVEGLSCAYGHYVQADLLGGMSQNEFATAFALTGMQRHLKAAGIFCRLHHRDGKSGYLKDIPRTLRYVQEVSEQETALADLAEWLSRRVLPHFVYEEESLCAP